MEFALVIPVFLGLVLGVIDGGRLVVASNSLAQAAREAARLAAVQAAWIGAIGADCRAPVCPASADEFTGNVVASANRMTALIGDIAASDVHITCTSLGSAPTGSWTGGNDCATSNDSGDVVTIRIVHPIASLTPLLDAFYPLDLSATATMAIP